MGFLSNLVSNPIGTIGDIGQSIINTVKDHPLEAAALGAAGYYFYPQISAWVAPSTGEAVAGTAAGTTAGAATSSLTGAQLAKLGITAASLLAGGNAIANATGGTGGLNLTTQDRSGFSAGSANYSPEYYAAIQSKYNQYMPQQQGKDITTDLKNWYETKYTPQVNVAASPTLTTTGTGYTTPTTLTNLNIPKQVVAPTYTTLTPSKSTATDIATEYTKFIASSGGNTPENRAAAIQYLKNAGFSGAQIDAAYNQYLSTLPKSTGTTADTLVANATPSQIAQAYASWVANAGGDTQANRAQAIQYLQRIGIPDATIQAAYPIYQSSVVSSSGGGGGGMLTGGGSSSSASSSASPQPSYTSLTNTSSPAAIAAAYSDFVSGRGGDTQANQQAAIDYLTNLGVSNDTIGQAYGLFKG